MTYFGYVCRIIHNLKLKGMKKSVIVLFASVIFLSCSSINNEVEESKIVDIEKIVGKPLDSLTVILGKSVELENTKYGPKYSFRDGDINVIFINDVADWITISNMNDAEFVNCSIDLLGDFNCINRTFKGVNVMIWRGLRGINEISFHRKYEGGDATSKIDYAYIKYQTE